jgi:CBS domain-containing protein
MQTVKDQQWRREVGATMRARDVMSSPVITLRPDTPVHQAEESLASHGFTAIPIRDAGGRMVGIVTKADLVRRRAGLNGRVREEAGGPTVATVMTLSPTSMHPDTNLADVAALMLDTRIRSVPILENGFLVGIVSARDVLRAVAGRNLTAAQPAVHSGEQR